MLNKIKGLEISTIGAKLVVSVDSLVDIFTQTDNLAAVELIKHFSLEFQMVKNGIPCESMIVKPDSSL